MKGLVIALALGAAVVAVSGCGTGSPATTSDRSAPGKTPNAVPLGNYTTTITGKEHFHGLGAGQLTPGTPSTGKWELTLSPAGVTLTHPENGFQVTPKATYENGEIKLAASKSCDVNLSPETPGLYAYHVVGGQLTLREVRDSCVDRAGTLTEEPWRRR